MSSAYSKVKVALWITIKDSVSERVDLEYDYRPNWAAQTFVTTYHNYNKMCDILGFFKIKMQEILQVYC